MAEYVDVDIYGGEDAQGNAIEHIDDAALNNSIVLWLTSKKGDYVNEPGKGGLLQALLFKQLTDKTRNRVNFILRDSIENEFAGFIELGKLEYTPKESDPTILEMNISYTSLITNKKKTVSFLTRTKPVLIPKTLKDVGYTGENLLNFVLLNLEDHKSERLLFDTELQLWVWGEFKLINFDASDPYFTQILALING